ncbi:unnamed protein product, partial [Ranitomeya imitator]
DGCDLLWEENNVTHICYQFNLRSDLSWIAARASCQAQGGDLLSIVNMEEQNYISDRLKSADTTLWIGLNQLDGVFGWQWSDGAALAFVNWKTNESRFTLSTCDRRDRVWRRRGEQSAACNLLQNDRFGSGSVMMWGGISLDCRTALHVLARGSLTAIRYRDEILRPLVRPYTGAVDPGFLLKQDNARPHVAGVCQRFLQDEGIEAMDWPARSPDLNPIEHIWNIMSRPIHQRHIEPQTVKELADALVQVWEEIPQETIRCLFRSMPWHVEATHTLLSIIFLF